MRKVYNTLLVQIVLAILPMTIFAQLKAEFSTNVTSGCSPLIVEFTNLSTGNPVSYLWRFGNGNTSSQFEPGAIYVTPGSYTITLVVQDANGNTDSIVKQNQVTVFAGPVSNFSSVSTAGCPPLTINFNNLSTPGSSPITQYTWDFGEGSTSSLQNPSHMYSAPGTYTVSLVVRDQNNCEHTESKQGYIVINDAPQTEFSANPTAGCSIPLPVQFTDLTPPGNYTYEWNFGDGQTSFAKNPVNNYQNSGNYNVSLKVTNSNGCSKTLVKNNYIRIVKDVPNFNPSVSSGCAPLKVNFSNTTVPGQLSATYFWDFGDGNTSNFRNPEHTYSQAGTYTVKLVVTSPGGCKDSIIKNNIITVNQMPVANFHTADTLGCNRPHTAYFTNTSTNAISYVWTSNSQTKNSTHSNFTYNFNDDYDVELIAISANGCRDTLLKPAYVKVFETRAFIFATNYEGCAPLTVKFDDSSRTLDPIINWHWDFGNGQTSNLQHPSATYTDTGKYQVKLTVTTQQGCKDSIVYNNVKAGLKVPPSFTASPLLGCNYQLDVQFVNTTNLNAPVPADRFFWTFGEGGVSFLSDPKYQYATDSGKYTVTLYSFHNGCRDSFAREEYVEVLPPKARIYRQQIACKPDTVILFNASTGADSVIWYLPDTTLTNKDTLRFKYPPGNYLIKLVAWNYTTGCSDTSQLYMTILAEALSASIIIDNTTGCAPVSFSAHFVSSKPPAEFLWVLSPNTTFNTSHITRTINTPGTYTLSIMVKDFGNCFAYDSVTITVAGPKVKFSASPLKGCVPLEVNFSDSTDSFYPVIFREWDFGNGITSDTSAKNFKYTYFDAPYDQPAGYTATLKITDSVGCSGMFSQFIYPSIVKPSILYQLTELCDSVVLTVQIPDSDTVGIKPFTYEWKFSDGSSYSTPQVHKSYKSTVDETVYLRLSDQESCNDTVTKQIKIEYNKLKVDFTAHPTTETCPPLQVSFTDSTKKGNHDIASWRWFFGDGSSSSNQNPVKIYILPGNFNVKLVVTDVKGCRDSLEVQNLITIDGPTGSFSFDKDSGCVPLTVNFSAFSNTATSFTWDMGDGSIRSGKNISHVYNAATSFIPLLILSNDQGCTYSLPPIDTINVFSLPEPDFSEEDLCFGYPTLFKDKSVPVSGDLWRWHWDFGNGASSTNRNPSNIYTAPGWFNVTLTSTNNKGCSRSITKPVKIGGLKIDFESDAHAICYQYPVNFTNKTFADTTVVEWQWAFGDGDSSDLKNPVHSYESIGKHDISLIGIDVLGCSDTLVKPEFIQVFDTIYPSPASITRVTVLDNNSVQVDFLPYLEGDFKEYHVYRKNVSGEYFRLETITSQFTTTYIEDTLNTLHNVYCYKITVETVCDRESVLDSARGHCTVELTATPGNREVYLNWNHYVGWDAILRYDIFRENINQPGDYVLIGAVPGSENHYIDKIIICYQTHFYKVKAIQSGGNLQVSYSDTSGTLPIYIPDVKPAEIIRATVEDNEHVFVEWHNPFNENVHYYLLERMDGEDGNFSNTITIPADVTSYNDFETDVNALSYTYRMQIVDSCNDASNYSNLGKSILLNVSVNEEFLPVLNWSHYVHWDAGVEFYEIQIRNNDGVFTTIGRTNSGSDTSYTDIVSDLNSLQNYCYRVIARQSSLNSIISVSNEDCIDVPYFIHVPNAFTPNGDSLNDLFQIKGMYIRDFNIKIYDRWGLLVFESNSLKHQWDGKFNGNRPFEDVYVYVIYVMGINYVSENIIGTVTILP